MTKKKEGAAPRGGKRPFDPPRPRNCRQCSKEFPALYGKHFYCSPYCRRKGKFGRAHQFQEFEKPARNRLIHIGAAAEMLVASDLLRKGWHVLQAVCGACPYDLMASFEGKHFSVEVKRGLLAATGNYVRHGMRKKGETPTVRKGTDFVAVVKEDGKVSVKGKPIKMPFQYSKLKLE